MCNRKYSRKFVDDLINNFLIEELVPDLLIDVLVGKKFLVSPITLLSYCNFDKFSRDLL